mmetsp:Transcript_5149/g.6288  ORF Transcript_5149/g.6288 Transcript_5149/m.6288 type:complete len:229 (+) Transcript_5149:435-1121(+)
MACSYSARDRYGYGTASIWNLRFFFMRFSLMITFWRASSARRFLGLDGCLGSRCFGRRLGFGGGAPIPLHDPHPATWCCSFCCFFDLGCSGSSLALMSSFSFSKSASTSVMLGAANARFTNSSWLKSTVCRAPVIWFGFDASVASAFALVSRALGTGSSARLTAVPAAVRFLDREDCACEIQGFSSLSFVGVCCCMAMALTLVDWVSAVLLEMVVSEAVLVGTTSVVE